MAAADVLLIADDPRVRMTLRTMLNEHVASLVFFESGALSIDEVVRRGPRLIFVQDELHNKDGLVFGTEIAKRIQTVVVLITSSESRAVQAYFSGIQHFLVTPLRREQLRTVLARTIGTRSEGRDSLLPNASLLRFRTKRGFIFVNATEIKWISAAANYLDIHCAAETHRVRGSVSHVSSQLREHPQFLRIHRSIIANMRYVREVRSSGVRDYFVVLDDFRELPVSRRRAIEEWISLACNMSSGPDRQEEVATQADADSLCQGVAAQRSNRI